MTASGWLREINTSSVSSGTGFMFGVKALALLLYRALGYTSPTEDVDIYGTGDSVTAPDGANKQTLTDGANKFVAGDVGRTITVSGMSNSNNNGSFTITDYVDVDQIKYVNAAGGAETSSFSWTITISDSSFFSTEKNGSNGEINITGSDFDFKDATASSFVAGDVGKWLLVCDPANPENIGLYEITGRTDATTITIDFRTGATEYPTQRISPNDDITWYILADDYQVPDRETEYFQLTTPHAYGWSLEIQRNNADISNYQGAKTRVAVDGYFGGSKIIGPVYYGVGNADSPWFYTSASDDFMNFMFYDGVSGYGGFIISRISPVEPSEKEDDNLTALMGCINTSSSVWGVGTLNVNENNGVANGYTWNDEQESLCHMSDSTYDSQNESLRESDRGLNKRTNLWDYEDVFIFQDWEASNSRYERIGSLVALKTITRNATVLTALNVEGTKDRFHVATGHAIEWPGYTEQY